jgi:hypothetical protein
VLSIKTKSHRFDFVAYENKKKRKKEEERRSEEGGEREENGDKLHASSPTGDRKWISRGDGVYTSSQEVSGASES